MPPAEPRITRWTDDELDELRRIYADLDNAEVARRLNRSIMAVASMASRLKLPKSAEQLARMGKHNRAIRKKKNQK